MIRLKQSEIAGYREKAREIQGGRCLLCLEPLAAVEAVLDHCHTTGEIRGVLHRGCNAMLGHIENNRPRHKLMDVRRFSVFLSRVIPYMNYNAGMPRTGTLHPAHKTDDEKRLLRNKRARIARAKGRHEAE